MTGQAKTQANVGGVCGISVSMISNCYNIGSVTGQANGIAYVGGVCGSSDRMISNCYNAGSVTGQAGENTYIGGVCGSNRSDITDCFYLAGTAKEGVGEGTGGDPDPSKKFGTEFIGAVEGWLAATDSEGASPWLGRPSIEQDKLMLPYLNIGDNVPAISCPSEPDNIDGFYEIYTATQLRWFAKKVNGDVPESDGEGEEDGEIKGKLMEDIAVSEYTLDGTAPAPEDHWTPIGNNKSPFKGTFDGNGKTVSGVYIIDDNNESTYLGLFGYLGEDGKIENVGVEDSYVKGTGQYAYVGGVCGYSSGGSISNSYNAGSVTGETKNTGEGMTSSASVGGVCGYSYDGTISNCYNIGSVTGDGTKANGWGDAYVGGVCGLNEVNSLIISNCYNAGSVTGQVGENASVGGVCGSNGGKITDCFYLAGTATNGIGDGAGVDPDPSKKFGTEFITAVEEWLVATGSEPSSSPWQGHPSIEQDKLMLPHLNIGDNVPAISCPPEPDNIDGFYEIYTATQLRWFATEVNDGATTINGKLMQSIEVSEYNLDGAAPDKKYHWTPIGKDFDHSFKGIFDGNGYKVSGVYIEDSSDDAYLGLFGCLGLGGKIENVRVEDSYVKGTGDHACVGGVCGSSSNGLISSSYNTGSVEGTGSNASVGGVCGVCSLGSSVSNSYNTGSAKGGNNAFVGGVCGYNFGMISNSYNTGSVEGGKYASVGGVCGKYKVNNNAKISNCYNVGSVKGGESGQVGGVCGNNNEGEITDCYYLAGTATNGIGDGTDSGNEKAAPKTAKELAEVMEKMLTESPWRGSANYESGTLTLPTFSESNPIVIQLVAVEIEPKDVIDFKGENWKDLEDLDDYLIVAGTSLKEAKPLSEVPLADLIGNATLYICHLGKASEVLEYKLERPDAPAGITATTTEESGVLLTVLEDVEYSENGKEWKISSTFEPVEAGKALTFYARYKANPDECLFPSKPAEIKVTLYSIIITSSDNGSVSANKTVAIVGEKVTLTVTPGSGYELKSLEVDGAVVSVSGNQHTFEMPDKAVTVTATFKKVKPTPAPDPVYYTVTIPESITGAIIHGGGTHQVREGSYIEFSIEIDPAGTGEYPTVTVDGYWWNTLSPDTRGNYRVYVYDDDCDIRIGEVSGYGTYTLTLPADSLFEGDDLYRSGVGIAVTPASSSPSSDALRYPFGTELTLTAVSDTHRTFVEWMDGSRRSPLTFRLREDTEAYAWFRALHPVGNEEIAAASIRIRTERGGTIVVDTPTRLPIAIYALSGQCLRRSESEGTTRFSGLREGSYLVVVGTHSEVVIVR